MGILTIPIQPLHVYMCASLIFQSSALSLLVLGILADNHDLAMSLYDLALFTNRLYRRTYFHDIFLLFMRP